MARASFLCSDSFFRLLTMSLEGKQSPDRPSYDEEKVGNTTHIELANNVQARYVLHDHGIKLRSEGTHHFSRIQNPLVGIPRDVLLKRVDDFTREKGLDDKQDLFRKAALLAQNPSDFETMPELSEEEKLVIRRETTRELHLFCFCYVFVKFGNLSDRWSQSRDLYLTVIICSVAAAVQ
jgi:hypothetical protein